MKLVDIARSWVGKNFNPGQKEQCMAFVRHCLTEASHPLASKITSKPVDGLSTGYYMASSLAGRDLGEMVDKQANLKPGAILFFNDTYNDGWPPNTITHVGIYVGEGQFVHRPTVSRPVVQESLADYGHFRAGLLVKDEAGARPAPPPKPPTRWRLYGKPGRMVLVCNQDQVLKAGQEIELDFLTLEMVDK